MLDQFAVKIPQEDIINDTKLKTDANAEDVCLWCNEDELNNIWTICMLIETDTPFSRKVNMYA